MSISVISNYQHAAEPEVPNPEEMGYHLVEANMNFLARPLSEGGQLSEDFQETVLTKIRCYSDAKALNSFNLFQHGFQYVEFEKNSPLTRTIDAYAEARLTETLLEEKELELSSQLQKHLVSWGKESGIPGIPVIMHTLYRNSDHGRGSPHSPYHFVHVDFSKEDTTNLSSGIVSQFCRPAAEKVFGEMSDEDYLEIKHELLINVWIPLHKKESPYKLAVLKRDSIEDLAQRTQSYRRGGENAYSLHSDPELVWVTKENHTLEDYTGLFFLTTETPHSAIKEEGKPESTRMSLEFRIDFMQKR